MPEDRRVRYDGGRVDEVDIESLAASVSDSVRVSESDCADLEGALQGFHLGGR